MRRLPPHNAIADTACSHREISDIPKSPAARKIQTTHPSSPMPTPPPRSEEDESQTAALPQSSAHHARSPAAESQKPAERFPRAQSSSPRETAMDRGQYQTHQAHPAAPPPPELPKPC